jgi:cell division protein FtsL
MAAVATRAARNARALERARTAPAAPRRKSGPVRKPSAAPVPVRRVAGSLVLDRLLRGRTWVVVIGALLAGIVFLNVSVLQLNRGIATTDSKAATLERTNSSLRERVATLNSAERIQRLAEQRGYILPQPGDVSYLKPASPAQARLAAQRITAPTPVSATPPTATTATTPTTTPAP